MGAVDAAYRVGPVHGDTVRASVISSICDPRTAVALDLERQLPHIAEQLSNELPRRSAAWRLRAMLRAVRLFFNAGGIDLAASLAYFTVLSLFPLVALVLVAATIFVDSEAVSGKLTEILSYYFPGSTDLIRGGHRGPVEQLHRHWPRIIGDYRGGSQRLDPGCEQGFEQSLRHRVKKDRS